MSTAVLVKQLRDKTGARFNDCAEAIKACDGDLEKAIQWLKVRNRDHGEGQPKQAKEGLLAVQSSPDDKCVTVAVEMSAGTDFAARNDEFKRMLTLITRHALLRNIGSVAELEKEVWIDSCTLGESVKALAGKLGEPIAIKRMVRVEGPSGFYLHNDNKQAAIVALDGVGSEEARVLGKDIAMHVVFAKPEFLSIDDVSMSRASKEIALIQERLKTDEKMANKPQDILDKISKGQLGKFYSKICLLEQPYYRENKLKVSDALRQKNKDAKIKEFHHLMVGE